MDKIMGVDGGQEIRASFRQTRLIINVLRVAHAE
jgi:hypothetical protein